MQEQSTVGAGMVDALTILRDMDGLFPVTFTQDELAAMSAIGEARRADTAFGEMYELLARYRDACLSVALKLPRECPDDESALFVVERLGAYAFAVKTGMDIETTRLDSVAKLAVTRDLVAATIKH